MNVLMIGGDRSALEKGSATYGRIALMRRIVGRIDVFIWPQVHSWHAVFAAASACRYDVVTSQDPFWHGLLAWRVARRVGAKLNLQIHADLGAQSFVKRLLARFLLRRADSIRVVSPRAHRELASLHLKAPISVLPIYIDRARFAGIVHVPHPHFKKTILWIGRFEPEKNPVEALTVLAHVRVMDVDAGLIMLGSGSLDRDLRIRATPFAGMVEFPGWQDPRPYLAEADVVLSTSPHESYGASIVEALAAGVPVVAPDVGVAREAGAVIAARNDLAGAVVTILRSGARGVLKLALPTAEEWALSWRATLI